MTAPAVITATLVPTDHGTDAVRQLVARWLRTRRSENTRDAYARDLELWLGWCQAHGVRELAARHAHVGQWLADLREHRGDADSTRGRRLAAVSSWYRWLARERLVDYNPADLDPSERPPRNDGPSGVAVPSRAQSERLLAMADQHGPRAAATVALLVYTGARVGELVGADVDDIRLLSGHPVLGITGKGRKRRDAPLPPDAFARVTAYLESRTADADRLPALAAGAAPARPLLATATGARWDQQGVYRLLRLLCRRGGPDLAALAETMSPHALRHAFATDLLEEGVPLYDVQRALGHADARTTQGYDHGDLTPGRHPAYKRAAQLRVAAGDDQGEAANLVA